MSLLPLQHLNHILNGVHTLLPSLFVLFGRGLSGVVILIVQRISNRTKVSIVLSACTFDLALKRRSRSRSATTNRCKIKRTSSRCAVAPPLMGSVTERRPLMDPRWAVCSVTDPRWLVGASFDPRALMGPASPRAFRRDPSGGQDNSACDFLAAQMIQCKKVDFKPSPEFTVDKIN